MSPSSRRMSPSMFSFLCCIFWEAALTFSRKAQSWEVSPVAVILLAKCLETLIPLIYAVSTDSVSIESLTV